MQGTGTFSGDERPALTRLMDRLAVPGVVRLALAVVVLDLLMFTASRVAFYMYFSRPDDPVPSAIVGESFYVGLKFDIRLALLMVLPVLVFGPMKWIGVFRGPMRRFVYSIYLLLVHIVVLSAYVLDFGHYAYLHERLNSSALRFLYNLSTSVEMISQTYPLGLILGGMAGFVLILWAVFWVMIRRGARYSYSVPVYGSAYGSANTPGRLMRWTVMTVCVALILAGIYGKASRYPLRWSDAFFSPNEFSSQLALNPMLYFAETLSFTAKPYEIKKVRSHYDAMAAYLGVDSPDADSLLLHRSSQGLREPAVEGKSPNIVIVLLESFVSYKTGVFHNPLNPTPNFDRLAREGLLFRRFYVPSTGTARSVFALITGIPDVESSKTSSRNPLIVRQHSIINEFKGYDKMYFLGGSLNWANIRGLLSHNIEGIGLYEEGSYSSPVVDVWGISDLDLFLEANNVFSQREKPFLAVVQTSGNHRPYTIPAEHGQFEYSSPGDKRKIERYGFYSEEEFNSYRFMDYSIGAFINAASREDYFDNTIFVFLADHGLPGNSPTIPKSEQQLDLTAFHVPLVIYAPGVLRGGVEYNMVASELDVMPTLAGIVGIPYLNTSLGRDLLEYPPDEGERYAFTITGQARTPRIGLVSDDFYFHMLADGKKKSLHDYHSDSPRDDVSSMHPEVARRMQEMTRAFYETARYIRYFNAPSQQ